MSIRAVWSAELRARLRTALFQAALLAVVGVTCAVLFNTCRHEGIAWIGDGPSSGGISGRSREAGTIRIDEAWRRYQEGQILFVDARSPSEYESAHLPGAVNVPAENAGKKLEELERAVMAGKELVIYCSGPVCPLSAELAAILADKGIRKLMILPEGWSGWLETGLPIEEKDRT